VTYRTKTSAGRKVIIYVACDRCGARTKQAWAWDIALFLPGKERRDCVSQNGVTVSRLCKDSGFSRVEDRHFCATCGGAAPAQMALGGVG